MRDYFASALAEGTPVQVSATDRQVATQSSVRMRLHAAPETYVSIGPGADHVAWLDHARMTGALACLVQENASLPMIAQAIAQMMDVSYVVLLVTDQYFTGSRVLDGGTSDERVPLREPNTAAQIWPWLQLANPGDESLLFCRRVDDLRDVVIGVSCSKERLQRDDLQMTMNRVVDYVAELMRVRLEWKNKGATVESRFGMLTKPEWETLEKLEEGEGEKMIADVLCRSPHTVHSHIKSIYKKLGAVSRIQAAAQARMLRRMLMMRRDW